MGQPRYQNGFDVTLQEDLVEAPLKWRTSKLIFVNSMSDLFHQQVPDDFIGRVFATMLKTPHHRYQVLTKRPDRAASMTTLRWPSNVWMGVSVETDKYIPRIDELRRIPARVRFLSLEPLLGPLEGLSLEGIHWVIVGGESGPGARPIQPAWVRSIRDQCNAAEVPFFFKQWGGTNKKITGRELDGRTWDELPVM